MNKISVFGSTGFIGSHFCNKYPEEVIPIYREDRVPQSDNILYLISTTHNYHILNDPTVDVKTNLLVFTEVLNHCAVPDLTFNFISSWFVYGSVKLPAKETYGCRPKGFYSITKLAAEHLLVSFCRTFGMKYRIFRLANVYGVGDKYSEKKNAFQFLLDKLYNNEKVELYYGGDFVRDYIHVDDVCGAIHHLMYDSPVNQIYNVGGGLPWDFGRLIRFCREELHSNSEITSREPSDFHKVVQVKNFWMDTTKLKSTGYLCTKDFRDFLREYKESKNGK